jgi:hypothetical protein
VAISTDKMTTLLSLTGGVRIGKGYWLAYYRTWPFVRLHVCPDRLVLTGIARGYEFPLSSITRLSRYRPFFCHGLRIEHVVSEYPPFVVFWTPDVDRLLEVLRENGFPVVTPAA